MAQKKEQRTRKMRFSKSERKVINRMMERVRAAKRKKQRDSQHKE